MTGRAPARLHLTTLEPPPRVLSAVGWEWGWGPASTEKRPASSAPYFVRTSRKPRLDVPLVTSDLPRLPTRYRAQY
jgi:hypothetical protein